MSFKELVEFVIDEDKYLALFATTVWYIWNRRNAMQTSSVQYLTQQVLHEVQAFKTTYVRSIPPKPPDRPNEAIQQLN